MNGDHNVHVVFVWPGWRLVARLCWLQGSGGFAIDLASD